MLPQKRLIFFLRNVKIEVIHHLNRVFITVRCRFFLFLFLTLISIFVATAVESLIFLKYKPSIYVYTFIIIYFESEYLFFCSSFPRTLEIKCFSNCYMSFEIVNVEQNIINSLRWIPMGRDFCNSRFTFSVALRHYLSRLIRSVVQINDH